MDRSRFARRVAWLGGLALICGLGVGPGQAQDAPQPALLVLEGGEKLGALNLGGDNRLTVTTGGIHVNSAHRAAVSVFNSTIQVQEGGFGVVGGVLRSGDQTVINPEPTDAEPLADPWAKLRLPGQAPLIARQRHFVGQGKTTTLKPGIYQGGLLTATNVKVTFAPGTYLFVNGDVFLNKGEFEGAGVTLVLTGDKPGKLICGDGSKITLSAPTTGDLQGLTLIARGPEQAVSLQGSQADFGGALYAPRGKVVASMKTALKATRLVAWNVVLTTGAGLDLSGE